MHTHASTRDSMQRLADGLVPELPCRIAYDSDYDICLGDRCHGLTIPGGKLDVLPVILLSSEHCDDEYSATVTLVHELAHVVDCGFAPASDPPAGAVEDFASMLNGTADYLAERQAERVGAGRDPHHPKSWVRLAVHLAGRCLIRHDVLLRPCEYLHLADYGYDAGSEWDALDALRQEVRDLINEPITAITKHIPPRAFLAALTPSAKGFVMAGKDYLAGRRETEEARKVELGARYAALIKLLADGDVIDDGDEADLVLSELGKTTEDVAKDVEKLKARIVQRSRLDTVAEMRNGIDEKRKEIAKGNAAIAKVREQWNPIIQRNSVAIRWDEAQANSLERRSLDELRRTSIYSALPAEIREVGESWGPEVRAIHDKIEKLRERQYSELVERLVKSKQASDYIGWERRLGTRGDYRLVGHDDTC